MFTKKIPLRKNYSKVCTCRFNTLGTEFLETNSIKGGKAAINGANREINRIDGIPAKNRTAKEKLFAEA